MPIHTRLNLNCSTCKICKIYAKYMRNVKKICTKYTSNMQNMHKSMLKHILHIWAAPSLLCWWWLRRAESESGCQWSGVNPACSGCQLERGFLTVMGTVMVTVLLFTSNSSQAPWQARTDWEAGPGPAAAPPQPGSSEHYWVNVHWHRDWQASLAHVAHSFQLEVRLASKSSSTCSHTRVEAVQVAHMLTDYWKKPSNETLLPPGQGGLPQTRMSCCPGHCHWAGAGIQVPLTQKRTISFDPKTKRMAQESNSYQSEKSCWLFSACSEKIKLFQDQALTHGSEGRWPRLGKIRFMSGRKTVLNICCWGFFGGGHVSDLSISPAHSYGSCVPARQKR